MFYIINFIDISNKLGHRQQKTGKVMICSRKPVWITPHVIRSPGNTNNSSKERWGHLVLRWRGYHTGDRIMIGYERGGLEKAQAVTNRGSPHFVKHMILYRIVVHGLRSKQSLFLNDLHYVFIDVLHNSPICGVGRVSNSGLT